MMKSKATNQKLHQPVVCWLIKNISKLTFLFVRMTKREIHILQNSVLHVQFFSLIAPNLRKLNQHVAENAALF